MQAPCLARRKGCLVTLLSTTDENRVAERADPILIQYKGAGYLIDASLMQLSFLITSQSRYSLSVEESSLGLKTEDISIF